MAESNKALIIAEKPSVAADIVRSLGPRIKFEKRAEWFESDSYLVTSAVGHLLEIKAPEEYEVKRGKWSFANLPVIPPYFDLLPLEKTKSRLAAIAKLIKRKDVNSIINACDAGREGELIFRHVVDFCKAKQPIQRLWLQSMTPQAIREGFEQLKSDKEVQPLADAARCRSEADWLVGINGTRAMTAFNSKDGGFFLTTVGRVQTPTLSIVVEREEQIRRFVSRDYFEVQATFAVAAGQYSGKWFRRDFKKVEAEDRADRIWVKDDAERIVAQCQHQSGKVEEETKPSSQSSPLLYDLTTLQREANQRFGFSAKTTLGIAQALYEKHKVLTYPRTDSRALPEDYIPSVKKSLEMLSSGDVGNDFATHASKVLSNNWVRPNKRVFDNSKISDHFAIIPTQLAPKNLSEVEAKIYDMVTRRFMAVFFPAAQFLVTQRITTVAGHSFKTDGKIMQDPGWLAVYGNVMGDKDTILVKVKANEPATVEEVVMSSHQTKPPARYTEATLLGAMENAGKLVEDEEFAEAMAEKGLGTPATRAATIEGLFTEQYLHREGRDLVPTAKAFQLMTLLRGLGVSELTQPELTGQWEHRLAQIQKGQLQRNEFMQGIAELTRTIVTRAKDFNRDTVPGDYYTLKAPCPQCGAVVKENYHRWACTHCEFSMGKHPGGRHFEVGEVEQLLTHRTIGPLNGFRSKLGRPFSAVLKIASEKETGLLKLEFDFGQGAEEGEAQDFSQAQEVGKCPKCNSRVFETASAYVCEKGRALCDFRLGRMILQQAIEPEQAKKLLETGRTDLLKKFISKKNRPFSAYLVRQTDGKIGFEFEERKKAATKTATKAGAEKSAAAVNGQTGDASQAAKPAAKEAANDSVAPKKRAAASKTKSKPATRAVATKTKK